MSDRVTRDVGFSWKWPTAEECETAHQLTDEQRVKFARPIERAARLLAATLCNECEIERQPIHLPVIRLLSTLKEAALFHPTGEAKEDGDEDRASPAAVA